jgi:serine/threonine protein kinase
VAGFRLAAEIAAGPHAIVYLGENAEGDRAAVKVYPPGGAVERVRREGAVQHQVAHPCVARLLAEGELEDGARYLVSSWVEGERLEDRLTRGPMTWPELSPVVKAIGRGLAAIHAAQVVHRDLKPTNIILPSAGEPAAVLLDFSHALVLEETRLTETGQVLGTAAYTAPEQAAGRALDARVDLYALGVIIYRALTGRLPHEDPSPAELMRKHLSEAVTPPRVHVPALPAAVEDLCMWLLAKDPTARVPNTRVLAITMQGMVDDGRAPIALGAMA